MERATSSNAHRRTHGRTELQVQEGLGVLAVACVWSRSQWSRQRWSSLGAQRMARVRREEREFTEKRRFLTCRSRWESVLYVGYDDGSSCNGRHVGL